MREIKSLHHARRSGREIAAATNLSEATVSRALRKLGMNRDRRQGLPVAHAKRSSADPVNIERHRRIVYHAARLFLRDGYERTSLENVALASGVAKSTIYRFFDNKLELASGVLRSSVSNVIPMLRNVLEGGKSLDDALVQFAVRDIKAMSGRIAGRPFYEFGRFALEISYRHPQVARMWLEEARIGIHAPLAAFLQRQIERGLLENIDASILAHHFSESLVYGGTLILATAEKQFALYSEAGIEEIARLKVRLFLDGCRKSTSIAPQASPPSV